MNNDKLAQFDYSILESEPGRIIFEDKRFLLMNADAHGKLRRDLIDNLGMERTKGFLHRYGWSCGYHDAEDKKKQYSDASDEFLIKQGALLHQLEGIVDVHIHNVEIDTTNQKFYLDGLWKHSYEAEQHVLHFGESNESTCWTSIGYAGGYASALLGYNIYYKEISCVGKGDESCRFIGKAVEEWGEEIYKDLHYYNDQKIAEELDIAYKKIQNQNELLNRTASLHEQLNQMVLSGKDRSTIIEKVGSLLNHPIIVEDYNMQPIEWWIPESSNLDLKEYLLGSYINEVAELRQVLKRVEKEQRALDWIKAKSTYHTIAPIIIGEELLGYITVIHSNDRQSEFIRMVIERTAWVLAIDFLKERIKLETEHRLKGEFIDELLDRTKPIDSLKSRAVYMGYDFTKTHQIIILEIEPKMEQELEHNFLLNRKRLFDLVNSVINVSTDNSLIVERQQGVLAIVFCNEKKQISSIVDTINNNLKKTLGKIAISICVSKVSNSINELRNVFSETQSTIQLLRNTGRSDNIFFVENTKSFDLLYAGPSQEKLISFSKNIMSNIIEYDKENSTELTWTLYVFLSTDCHLKKTAELLNLSVSGLKYRIQRIKDISKLNWEEPEEQFNLFLSLKVLRINGFMNTYL